MILAFKDRRKVVKKVTDDEKSGYSDMAIFRFNYDPKDHNSNKPFVKVVSQEEFPKLMEIK